MTAYLTSKVTAGICKGGEFEGVKPITPKCLTEEYEGQHPMFTPPPTKETADWLRECDIKLINSEAEHTTHFTTTIRS